MAMSSGSEPVGARGVPHRAAPATATFVLLPGAGGDSWYWHLVAPRLRSLGHQALTPDLPAADDAAGLGEYADALWTRSVIALG